MVGKIAFSFILLIGTGAGAAASAPNPNVVYKGVDSVSASSCEVQVMGETQFNVEIEVRIGESTSFNMNLARFLDLNDSHFYRKAQVSQTDDATLETLAEFYYLEQPQVASFSIIQNHSKNDQNRELKIMLCDSLKPFE
jgi:hypothetical protein